MYRLTLKVFLADGEVPMDNNASERAIRGFCIGKKNWEMIDTINGAKTSAIIYSIAETAKANKLKPYEYFDYLLTEIPKHMDESDKSFLKDLLPCSPNLPENIRKSKGNNSQQAAKAAYSCQGTRYTAFTQLESYFSFNVSIIAQEDGIVERWVIHRLLLFFGSTSLIYNFTTRYTSSNGGLFTPPAKRNFS